VTFAVSCDTTEGPVIVNGTLVLGNASVVTIEHAGMANSKDAVKRADDLVAAALEQMYRSYCRGGPSRASVDRQLNRRVFGSRGLLPTFGGMDDLTIWNTREQKCLPAVRLLEVRSVGV
jgi:hypothetical protein